MTDNTNYSLGRYLNDGVRVPARLGIHEHIVDDTSGGSDTGALPATQLTERNLSPQQVGALSIKVGLREFVLGRTAANTAVGPALLVSADFSVNSIAEFDDTVVANAGIGSTNPSITDTALDSVTEDQFANGYLSVTDGTGKGYMYGIKSNTADDGNDKVEFVLYEPIVVAWDTTSDFSIIGNPFDHLVNATAATDTNVVGTCVANVDADGTGIQQYCWVQTKGPSLIVADAAVAIAKGDILALSSNHAGNVMQLAGGGVTAGDVAAEPLIGYALDTPDDTGHVPVWLNLT